MPVSLPCRGGEGGGGLAGRKAKPLRGAAAPGRSGPALLGGLPAARLVLQYYYFCVWEVSLLFCVCSYPDSILKFTINVSG